MPLTALIAIDNFFKNKIIKNTAIITTVFQWMILIVLWLAVWSWVAAFIAHGMVFVFLPKYRFFIKNKYYFSFSDFYYIFACFILFHGHFP